MSRPYFPVALSLVSAIAVLTGCGQGQALRTDADEPFNFARIRELSYSIDADGSGRSNATVVLMRRNAPLISRLYGEALVRFDGIYGEGVGPVRRAPGYLECKAAFRDVAGKIASLPVTGGDDGIRLLWAQLLRCRENARRWAGAGEMSTFGNDLEGMTEGSMLVLIDAAAASGSALARDFYAELSGSRDVTPAAH